MFVKSAVTRFARVFRTATEGILVYNCTKDTALIQIHGNFDSFSEELFSFTLSIVNILESW